MFSNDCSLGLALTNEHHGCVTPSQYLIASKLTAACGDHNNQKVCELAKMPGLVFTGFWPPLIEPTFAHSAALVTQGSFLPFVSFANENSAEVAGQGRQSGHSRRSLQMHQCPFQRTVQRAVVFERLKRKISIGRNRRVGLTSLFGMLVAPHFDPHTPEDLGNLIAPLQQRPHVGQSSLQYRLP